MDGAGASSVPTHQVFGALGDPSRLDLVGLLLRHGPSTATELAGHLTITRQAVAKHLGVLADAALVQAHREGRHVRYALQPAQLDAARSWLARTATSWDSRLDALDVLVQAPDDPAR
ncbi:MAG TPA: metalloregulator ArsR/SmtB family transcription factor [Euzebya sp.]|nr:metalloregulator ArsR/SmtB family transcription factor [Euzebya sp.]